MQAFCLNAVSPRQLRALLVTEVHKPVGTSLIVVDEAPISGVEALPPASHDDLRSPSGPYQMLASKKPKPRSTASRPTKRKTSGRLRRGAVLVVDDVPDVTEMIGLLLKHAGYDVSTADSARAALQLARRRHYDLVISDIGMPEMNGYELAAALRHLKEYFETPMIAVTGYSEYDDRGRAVNAGFNVHLTKPIEPAQLLNLMNELLSQSESGTNH